MPFTADSPVVNVDPDISAEQFAQVLSDAGSPAAPEAHAAYVAITGYRISPRYLLACFHRESRYGTDPQSVNVRYGTKNPGNNRSLRANIPNAQVIMTDRGQFVSYSTWTDGWTDAAYRLADPNYVYAQQGRTTPAQIIPTSAPASDHNDPTAYIADVVAMMNSYPQGGANVPTPAPPNPASLGTLPVVQTPAAAGNYDGTFVEADLGIQHVEQSHSAQSAVNEFATPGTQVSVQFVYDPATHRFDQPVGLDKTAYGCGNYAENQRAWQMEAPYNVGDTIPAATVTDIAIGWAALARIGGIPAQRVTRQSFIDQAQPRGFCGHSDIPSPAIPRAQLDLNNPNHWGGSGNHSDPGPTWPWDAMLAAIQANLGAPPHPVVVAQEIAFSTGYKATFGFAQFWQKWGGLLVFGLALDDEHDEQGQTVQHFERARFEWHQGLDPDNWDTQLGLAGTERATALGYLGGDSPHPAFARATQHDYGDPNAVYDDTTGHNIAHGFHAYWEKFGDLRVFGHPLSEEFEEGGLTVQYFERARFEWHPGARPDRFDVLLGRIVAEGLGQ